MGKSAEVIDGKGVASLHCSQRVRNDLKIKKIDRKNVWTLYGPDVSAGMQGSNLSVPRLREQGERSADSAGAIGTPWRDMGDRKKNRSSESNIVYQKVKICQAVNKWFG